LITQPSSSSTPPNNSGGGDVSRTHPGGPGNLEWIRLSYGMLMVSLLIAAMVTYHAIRKARAKAEREKELD
jgi:hypothetical protein